MSRRYCLWGGGSGADWIQIGSSEDRCIQALTRMTAHMMRLRYAMGLMTVAAGRAEQSFKVLGAAIEHSMLW